MAETDEVKPTTTTEEESTAQFTAVVKLDVVETKTGQEDEDELFTMRGKLYRFTTTMLDKGTDNKTWVQRGVGDMKILKHREFGMCRLLMRQEKTMKIICNHMVKKDTELSMMPSSDRAWIWPAADFANGESIVDELFALRVKDTESAKEFEAAYKKAQEINKALEEDGDDEETAALGDALKAADVSEKKSEDKTETIFEKAAEGAEKAKEDAEK